MRSLLLSPALLLTAPLFAQTVDWQHLYQAGSGMVQATATAVDPAGNLYVTGFFAGNVDVDPGEGEVWMTSTGDFIRDGFVLSYAPDGAFRWKAEFDGDALLYPKSIAADAGGGVVVGGTFVGNADLDPGVGTQPVLATDIDAFLVRLDGSGALSWSHTWSNGNSLDLPSVGLHPDGSVTCGIRYFQTLDVDPGAGTVLVSSGPPSDAAVIHLNSAGAFAWVRQIDDGGDALMNALAVDPLGRIVVCGMFGDTLTLPGVPELIAPTLGGYGFVVCFDANGQGQWIQQLDGIIASQGFTAVATGSDGRVVVTAQLQGTVDIDLSENELEVYIAGYSPAYFVIAADGGFLHSGVLHVSSGFADRGSVLAMAFGPDNDLWLTGEWTGTIDTDPGDGIASLMYYFSSPDCFLVHLDADGQHLWNDALRGDMWNSGRGLACDNGGDLHLAAQVSNDFTPFLAGASDPQLNGGATSSIVVKLAPGNVGLAPLTTAATALSPYPSPADDHVWLTGAQPFGQLVVYTASGAVHFRGQVNAPSIRLDVATWPPGLYVVEWQDGEHAQRSRFVKR